MFVEINNNGYVVWHFDSRKQYKKSRIRKSMNRFIKRVKTKLPWWNGTLTFSKR